MIMPNDDNPNPLLADTGPKFHSGQLVAHRRYRYRGVIVEFDLTCKAEDDWYYSNQTQPDKTQPWYHVLVHGTEMTTYAAQENLMPDPLQEPIDHPLLEYFFSEFRNGIYVRNDIPWPM